MGAMAIVQAEVDAEVEKRAAELLQREGLSVEEAVREMLRRTIAEGGLPFSRIADDDEIYGDNDPVYDPMFRAKVQEALDDPRPALSAEEAEQRMAQRRVSAMARVS